MTADQVDSEATGLILLARSKEVLVSLANLFGSEKPLRKYVTLVQGSPSEERFEVDAKLANDPVRAGLMRIEPHHGKRARTLFSVRERFAGWTLLDCEPLTVRKHQVRVHLRYKRLRVAGDLAYGGNPLLLSNLKSAYHLKPGKTERPLLSQPGLHAERLELPHPVSGAALTLVAPWPKDLSVAVKYLRRYAAPAAG
jgi:23S rRNA-/tRNA-specific pseudouridylate synthase